MAFFRRWAAAIGTTAAAGLIVWFVPESTPTRNPILLIVLACPLIFGLVPRNWFYGLRTPYTMASDARWYPQNVISGIALLLWGVGWLVMVLLR
jgi:hypothetical protein